MLKKKLAYKFFNKEDLSKIIVPNPSNVVQKEIGTPSVAEASCLLAAGEESKLLEEKRIFKKSIWGSNYSYGRIKKSI